MKADIYNVQGKKTGTIELPEALFGLPWNNALIHQVVTSMQSNARAPLAHAKFRGEVSGGGKKPWRQKGTGRARHGSIRSPIWRGGGVTHGPRAEKSYARAIPKKMRTKALFVALSKKFADGQVVFVDNFGLEEPKTASAKKALSALSGAVSDAARLPKTLVALPDPREAALKSFRNIGTVTAGAVRDLNPLAVLAHSLLVIENPEAALAVLEQRTHPEKSARKAAAADAKKEKKGAKKNVAKRVKKRAAKKGA